MQTRRGSILGTRKIADPQRLVGMGCGVQYVEARHWRTFGLHASGGTNLSRRDRIAQLRIYAQTLCYRASCTCFAFGDVELIDVAADRDGLTKCSAQSDACSVKCRLERSTAARNKKLQSSCPGADRCTAA